ncbi:hypothetical protein [Rubripirellula reticaptiva]|uniref:hypothetical protein n=1 Tax=Rubripirellula reticaptiva TaxID=2528013 RepID=UPI0011B5DBC1|nr:hypothetical protein [Rubripirellula reticaptiva]
MGNFVDLDAAIVVVNENSIPTKWFQRAVMFPLQVKLRTTADHGTAIVLGAIHHRIPGCSRIGRSKCQGLRQTIDTVCDVNQNRFLAGKNLRLLLRISE